MITAKLRIMIRAIEIRLNNGEELKDILESYPSLTDLEIFEIRQYFEDQE